MPPPLTGFQAALLEWAAADPAGRRSLPWRQTRDPWAVLVSEVMLQQTQVARVVPVFSRFLERFPTAAACAAATPGDVVRAWAGLGYNRRALNLHRCAAVVVERHGGRVPADDLAALLALPGVGPYTARAVAAFAAEADTGVLDTNAARVAARAAAGRRLGRAEAQATADRLVPPGRGWAWSSAVLDLGATVCTSRRPACDRCPLVAGAHCAWHRAGRPEPDPAAGSAGTSGRQSTFAGSDRQGRGRLVAALRQGPLDLTRTAAAAGWPDQPERAARIADQLVAEGLAVTDGSRIRLP